VELKDSVKREFLGVLAAMVISVAFGFPITWLAGILAPPRLGFTTAIVVLLVLSDLSVGVSGFVAGRIAGMRAAWIYAIVQFLYSLAASIWVWGLMPYNYYENVSLLLIIPCAVVGGKLSNRPVSGTTLRSPWS